MASTGLAPPSGSCSACWGGPWPGAPPRPSGRSSPCCTRRVPSGPPWLRFQAAAGRCWRSRLRRRPTSWRTPRPAPARRTSTRSRPRGCWRRPGSRPGSRSWARRCARSASVAGSRTPCAAPRTPSGSVSPGRCWGAPTARISGWTLTSRARTPASCASTPRASALSLPRGSWRSSSARLLAGGCPRPPVLQRWCPSSRASAPRAARLRASGQRCASSCLPGPALSRRRAARRQCGPAWTRS
mmetsp:Transcript_25348/g.79584  ORF Transcript_25348/g.79584 Transcript_25348/m.79584 type:complete len:242 (+) Transcript_25348:491-1216(+)